MINRMEKPGIAIYNNLTCVQKRLHQATW